MFEYLSFLRPPPEACRLGQAITFVPQIANDLRTEPCETEHNIYFVWQSDSGALDRTGFTKLTTWRPGSRSYKPLSVALPSGAQPGGAWRLCLAVGLDSRNMPQSLVLDLLQNEFGRLPFPVTSLPISVLGGESVGPTGKARGIKLAPNKQSKAKSNPPESNISKQEKIERFYMLPANWGTLRITEQTSFDLDKKIWDSGVAVSSWLAKLLALPKNATQSHELTEHFRRRLQPARDRDRALQVIELGTGTGLVSLVLGTLLSQCGSKIDQTEEPEPMMRARILATDLSSAIELIDHNKLSNSHLFGDRTGILEGSEEARPTSEIELHAAELDWDNPIPPSVWAVDQRSGTQYPFDIIIMADVTYNTASFGALLDTVTGLLRGPSASGSSAIVLLAYKCRDPAERTLWTDALAQGVTFVQVDTVKGVREPAVEIWLGGWERDVKSLWLDAH
ncbi:unnamed protein product [Rhizoctonia solani]|uniref:Methyltransferase-domain-containing protein n=1 Tax=Rhizoctonia solani TaxID=456999 RepID=A0A8H3HIK8_9AGAM|nr:unnamed protein product [Rhizoctonia solani]